MPKKRNWVFITDVSMSLMQKSDFWPAVLHFPHILVQFLPDYLLQLRVAQVLARHHLQHLKKREKEKKMMRD